MWHGYVRFSHTICKCICVIDLIPWHTRSVGLSLRVIYWDVNESTFCLRSWMAARQVSFSDSASSCNSGSLSEMRHIYIYAFSRRFYPKWLIQVIHVLSVCVFPGNRTHNLCAANTMLYHWATDTDANEKPPYTASQSQLTTFQQVLRVLQLLLFLLEFPDFLDQGT